MTVAYTMANINLTRWEDALVAQFGKRAKRHVEAVMCDLLTVDFGIKPAYLWDVLHPNVQKVASLVSELRQKATISNCINVLTIGDEVFVVHLKQVICHLKKLVADGEKFLVDISKVLESPLMAGVHLQANLKSCLEKIVIQLEGFGCEQENGNIDFYGETVLNVEVDNSWNLSTVFGALLGYPVLYCYNNNEGNCLSLCPLRVYSVDLEVVGKVQGVPDEKAPIRQTVYSFSVPESLVPFVTDRVRDWFACLHKQCQQQNIMCKLFISQETVTHSVVTL